MSASIIRTQGYQLPQDLFRVRETALAHVKIDQAGKRVTVAWRNCERLPIFFLCVFRALRLFEYGAGEQMWLGIFGIQNRSLIERRNGVFRLTRFEETSERHPDALLTLYRI